MGIRIDEVSETPDNNRQLIFTAASSIQATVLERLNVVFDFVPLPGQGLFHPMERGFVIILRQIQIASANVALEQALRGLEALLL